uniref:C2H2-type domain-containing protein n=1 Tax=viral metagenome TaxID=1070528 RepID=A0A6C0EA99_9ZZZZ
MSLTKNSQKSQKIKKEYNCECCNYNTSYKKDYSKHILTAKHKKLEDLTKNRTILTDNISSVEFICNNCNKKYNSRVGLWYHKNKNYCNKETRDAIIPEEVPTIIQGTKLTAGSSDIPIELILEVIKQSKEVQNVLIEQNKELQKQLLEQNEKMLEQSDKHHKEILEIAKKPNMINSNNNNKTSFNLQFFLNETCKDAMNIVDFVNSLKLTNNDFETTGKLGFVNGISRIFINNLKKMDVITRPLHCTDVKRETVYIKDNDTWEKDNEEKKKLNWAVNRIAQLNLNQIQQWQQEFPDSVKNNTPANEKFTELALAALGGRDMEEIHKYNEKIMKNVLKEVILSREP